MIFVKIILQLSVRMQLYKTAWQAHFCLGKLKLIDKLFWSNGESLKEETTEFLCTKSIFGSVMSFKLNL